jgi:hypothetical protein
MVGMKAKITIDVPKVKKAADDATFKNLNHAAAFIRTVSRRSIVTSPKPGRPGGPPRTRGARRLRNAILFAVERDVGRATIGPDAAILGKDVGGALEHGGEFRGEFYHAMPYMGPALKKARPKLPKIWTDSVT